MSVEAITWAFSQKVGSASAKAVLVAMANCAGHDFMCWPSMAYLEDVTEQNRKTVLSNIKRLKSVELIAPTDQRRGHTGQIVVYLLNPPKNGTVKQVQKRNSTETGTVPFSASKSTVFGSKQAQKRDTEPLEPLEPSSKAKAISFSLPDWIPQESWEAWVEMRKSIKKPLTDKAKAMAVTRLAKLQADGNDPAEVLDQSTLNNWQDLYAIKTNQAGRSEGESDPFRGAL